MEHTHFSPHNGNNVPDKYGACHINGRFRKPQDPGQDLELRRLQGAEVPTRLIVAATEVRSNPNSVNSREIEGYVTAASGVVALIVEPTQEAAIIPMILPEDGQNVSPFYARG